MNRLPDGKASRHISRSGKKGAALLAGGKITTKANGLQATQGKLAARGWIVVDDFSGVIPVSRAESEVLELLLGENLNEILGGARSLD